MIPTYRCLMNLRCPDCDAVQPAFNVLCTFKGGLSLFAVNDHAHCINCPARLRLVPTTDPIQTVVVQLLPVLVVVFGFLFVLIPLFGALLSLTGIWGLVPIVVLFFCAPFMAAAIIGRISPLYRKVIAL